MLAVWPGQTDATYLIGLMAYTYGNLDLAIAYVRQACDAPARRPFISATWRRCAARRNLRRGRAGGSPRGGDRAEPRPRLEQSRHRPAGDA